MNRKILLTVLALAAVLLATPYIGMVHATGKGTTKQYYEFYLEGYDHPGPDTKYWMTKDGVIQIRDFVYTATYIEVTVGGTKYYPDPASYSCTMDFTLDTVTLTLDIRVHETFVVAGGTIAQNTAETLTNYGLPTMTGGGSFVGFGSDGLAGVKIQGTTAMTPAGALDRVGTVMGWP